MELIDQPEKHFLMPQRGDMRMITTVKKTPIYISSLDMGTAEYIFRNRPEDVNIHQGTTHLFNQYRVISGAEAKDWVNITNNYYDTMKVAGCANVWWFDAYFGGKVSGLDLRGGDFPSITPFGPVIDDHDKMRFPNPTLREMMNKFDQIYPSFVLKIENIGYTVYYTFNFILYVLQKRKDRIISPQNCTLINEHAKRDVVL